MDKPKIIALYSFIMAFLLFGVGGYYIYFLKMPLIAFLLLPFSLLLIHFSFSIMTEPKR